MTLPFFAALSKHCSLLATNGHYRVQTFQAARFILMVICFVYACDHSTANVSATKTEVKNMCISQQWTYFGGFCYFFERQLKKWNASLSSCQSNNSHLLDIQSLVENAFIARHNLNCTLWIGYNDYAKEGTFVWSNTNVTGAYTNWNTGEPNNANKGEHCAVITTKNLTGKWLDVDCNGSYPSVCKQDVNECTGGSHGCHVNATCKNTDGSYTCTCNYTYVGNGKNCIEMNSLCGQQWTYFRGYCYLLDSKSSSWNESRLACRSYNANLVDIQSKTEDDFLSHNFTNYLFWIGYNDFSKEGVFVWSRTKVHGAYTNWHPGEPNDANQGEDCVGMMITGGWLDLPCHALYNSVCKKDVDECAIGNNDCHANATCTNIFGSYTCKCKEKWFGNGRICAESFCGDKWALFGGFCYYINKKPETWFSAELTCGSYNSYLLDIQSARENALVESYNNNTLFWIGFNDLHTEGKFVWSHPDVSNSYTNWDSPEPNNAFGGEDCAIMETTRLNGTWLDYPCFFNLSAVCKKDLDECSVGSHNCHAKATCMNTIGSYTCTCPASFSGDGKNCTDVDECSVGYYTCHANATCENTFGSYWCLCSMGFVGNGKNCSDKNECSIPDRFCHANATCANTFGSYRCTCQAGFVGDGRNCADIEECPSQSHNCSKDATCTYNGGKFSCKCNEKFDGNGVTCTKLNCSDSSPPQNGWKSTNETWIDTLVTFGCNGGFKLDGNSVVKCEDNQMWNATFPQCLSFCPNLQTPNNGRKSSSKIVVGTEVTFACNDGYKLSGEEKLICKRDKQWSTQPPNCTGLCPHLPTPNNGRKSSGKIVVGTEVTFTCNDGYKLSGEEKLICRTDRQWSTQPPNCTEDNGVSSGSGSGSSFPVVFVVVPVAVVVFILVVILVIYRRKRRSKRTPRGVIPSGLEMLSQRTSTNTDGETTTENYYSSGEEALVAQNSATNDNLDRRAQTGAGQENERYSLAQPSEREVKVDSPSRTPRPAANADGNPSDYDLLSRQTNSKSPHQISSPSTGLDAAADTYDHVDRSANQDTDSKDANAKEALAIGEMYSRLSRSAMDEDPNELTAPSFNQPMAATGNEQYAQLNRPNPAPVYSIVHKDKAKP